MSNFLHSHPISHLVVLQILTGIWLVFFLFGMVTRGSIAGVPRDLWSSTRHNRRTWIAAATIALALFYVSIVAWIAWSEYVGEIVIAPALIVPIAWRLWPRRDLRARAATMGLPDPVPPGRPAVLFGPATRLPLKIFRAGLCLFAAIGFGIAEQSLDLWTIGDPDTVYITNESHDIQPKSYIVHACEDSVVSTLHLKWDFPEIDGHSYQRWSVVPKPGHLDEVLLDTDTGQVICP